MIANAMNLRKKNKKLDRKNSNERDISNKIYMRERKEKTTLYVLGLRNSFAY